MVLSTRSGKVSLVAFVLVVAIGAGPAPKGMEMLPGTFPVPENIADFLQREFAAVPAPHVAASVSGTRCSEIKINDPNFRGVNGTAMKTIYICAIDYGCDQKGEAPVWLDAKGTLWFGPDSPGRLVAMNCPDSITDPLRRKYFAAQVDQGG